MDGFEVARRLRAHPNCEHLPIIFVTAMDDVAAQRRGLSLGAVDYLTKPIDPDLLRLRVHNFGRLILRQKERQREYDEMLTDVRLREDIDRMLRHDWGHSAALRVWRNSWPARRNCNHSTQNGRS